MKSLRYLFVLFIIMTMLCIGFYLAASPQAIAPFLSSLLMMAIPLALGVYLARRLKADWRVYGIGMLTFIGSQLVHIPFNNWTLNPILKNLGLGPSSSGGDLILLALLGGLSAGVFEETARYIVYRRWLADVRTWGEGLMFGAGHGGVEAMILGALAFWQFLIAWVTLNSGQAAMAPQTQAFLDAYWNNPWHFYLLPALERVAAICVHLSAALLVLRAVTRRNLFWYLAAIGWHTTVNAAAYYAAQTWDVYTAEGLLVIAAALSLWVVYSLRDEETARPLAETLAQPNSPKEYQNAPDVINSQKLEDSRYD
ncbi:MAG: YhfC family intramembrane metalloprotease [Anaerolineae bacterium]|nr:YhfC family intramembrane metalloprotease [Anaerolineae bacterium]